MIQDSQIQTAKKAAQALINANLNVTFLPLAFAQLAHETAGFKSHLAADDNNLSGIKYLGKPSVQKQAKQGSMSPEGNYYAHFTSVNAWAVDYVRILSMGARPIDATSIDDLAARLKSNGYYTDSLSNYTAGLSGWLGTFDQYIADVKKKTL